MLNPVQDTLPFDDLAEIPNASDWCQRWQGRRHSFRHVSEGGFDARRYAVEAVPEKEAKEFVVGHHYSGSFPSARIRFGLYDIGTGEARLCGVAVFGVPMRADVLTLPLPDLQPYAASVECSWADECPANVEFASLTRLEIWKSLSGGLKIIYGAQGTLVTEPACLAGFTGSR